MKQIYRLASVIALVVFTQCTSSDSSTALPTDNTETPDSSTTNSVPEPDLAEDTANFDNPTEQTLDFDDDAVQYEAAFAEEDTTHYYNGDELLYVGEITGTFLEVQVGDYMHFMLLDEGHMLHSFWIANEAPYDLIEEMAYEKADEHKGRKVKVSWIRERKFIPESGNEMVLYSLTNVVFID